MNLNKLTGFIKQVFNFFIKLILVGFLLVYNWKIIGDTK